MASNVACIIAVTGGHLIYYFSVTMLKGCKYLGFVKLVPVEANFLQSHGFYSILIEYELETLSLVIVT